MTHERNFQSTLKWGSKLTEELTPLMRCFQAPCMSKSDISMANRWITSARR